MASENGRPMILSASTLMPLGAFLIVSIGGYQVYDSLRGDIRDGIQSNRDDIRDVREDVRALRTELSSKTDDRWRKTDMKLWAAEFRSKNPNAVVPPVD